MAVASLPKAACTIRREWRRQATVTSSIPPLTAMVNQEAAMSSTNKW